MKKHLLLIFSTLALGPLAGSQTLLNPVGYQATYPSASTLYKGNGHTSCYHLPGATTPAPTLMGSTVDFYVTGTTGAYGGVTWQAMSPGTTSPALYDGIIPMPKMMDIEVGVVTLNMSPAIVVAYYNPGKGHFIDVYECPPGTATFSLSQSIQLSTASTYTRISADFHKGYGIIAAWEDKGAINTIFGNASGSAISWSKVLTLAGTGGGRDVDVAFSHGGSSPMSSAMHYVYKTVFPAYSFVEIKADWSGMIGGSSPYSTVTEDVLNVAPGNVSIANIDCPDHYTSSTTDNWAYTFATTSNYEYMSPGIIVRSADYATSSTPTTTNLTNGSLGNAPMSAPVWSYDLPTLSYEENGSSMYIGWYAEATPALPNFGSGHVLVQIDKSATMLMTDPDYLIISSTATQNAPLALSKMNDVLSLSDYVYAAFYDSAPADVVEHAWHARNFPSGFRGTGSDRPAISCGPEVLKSTSEGQSGSIRLYPNPFNAALYCDASGDWSAAQVQVKVYTVTGTAIALPESGISEAMAALNKVVRPFAPGTYFVSVTDKAAHRTQSFTMMKRQ